jgi:RNA polymerase sigma factor (sigma-70 family)
MTDRDFSAYNRNKYADYIDTGGFSKRMIYAYIFLLLGTAIFVWFLIPLKAGLASLFFLLSLPLLFFYRFCHYAMKTFGPFNTPLTWHKQSMRLLIFSLIILLLGGAVFLSYPMIDSFIAVACALFFTVWIINLLAKHHIRVTITAMTEQGKSSVSEAEILDASSDYDAKNKESIDDALMTLTEREERVIRLRWGIGDGCRRTLDEVAQIFNTTPEKIEQIEAKALRRLRHPKRAEKLKNIFDIKNDEQ